MSNSIRISEKHGLNPTITKCIFCGQDKGIAILGRLKNDTEAPMYSIVDYEPCDDCKKNWSMGIPLLRVTTVQPKNGMPPFTKHGDTPLYPTGMYMVMTQDAVKRIFGMNVKKGNPVCIEDAAFDKIVNDINAASMADQTGGNMHEKN